MRYAVYGYDELLLNGSAACGQGFCELCAMPVHGDDMLMADQNN